MKISGRIFFFNRRQLSVAGLLLPINGPLTNQGPVNFSLAKKLTKLEEENAAPD